MDGTAALTMKFDPATDFVRVSLCGPDEKAVAVPLEDLTILLTPGLDAVIGINIHDLPTFVARYVPDEVLPTNATGSALFEAARPHLVPLMELFTRNLGPIAKDRVAQWDEAVQSALVRHSRAT